MFLDGMGERESIASQLSETVYFCDLRPSGVKPYVKITTKDDSYYSVPFVSRNGEIVGIIRIHQPLRIEVKIYVGDQEPKLIKFRHMDDVKSFLIQDVIQ